MSEQNESFLEEWAKYKVKIDQLAAIVISQAEAIKMLDSKVLECLNILNQAVAAINVTQAQIKLINDMTGSILELSYEGKKINKTNVSNKLKEINIRESKKFISEKTESGEIQKSEVVSVKTFIVYKTDKIEYGLLQPNHLIDKDLGKKIGEKISLMDIDEKGKTFEYEAEIIDLYDYK